MYSHLLPVKPATVVTAFLVLLFWTHSVNPLPEGVTADLEQARAVINDTKKTHMGDERHGDWEAWRFTGLNYSMDFYVEGPFKKAWIDMMIYGQDSKYNKVLINGKPANYICCCPWWRWQACNLTLPPGAVQKGQNNITFLSSYMWLYHSWDDFMLDDIKLWVEYHHYEPYITVEKTQSSYEVYLGDEINVSVIANNLGARGVKNITLRDVRPPQTVLKKGNLTYSFYPMRGGDFIRYTYTLLPERPGAYKSPAGWYRYVDLNNEAKMGVIEQTEFMVKPLAPKLFIFKSFKNNVSFGKNLYVKVSVKNIGKSEAFNVTVIDYLPKSYEVSAGSANFSISELGVGESASFSYNLTQKSSTMYTASAFATYVDGQGYRYNSTSNPLDFMPPKVEEEAPPDVASKQQIVLGVIVLLIVVLVIVLFSMNTPHSAR